MGSAIDSPRSDPPRPRLWMLFAGLALFASSLVLAGLLWVRVHDDQLYRQTESELVAQGAVVAELYASELKRTAPRGYGRAPTEPWPHPREGGLRPVLPTLRASSPVLPAAQDPKAAAAPADPIAIAAAAPLVTLLPEVAKTTLAGIRLLDGNGTVIATSNVGLGTTHADREEVRRALGGAPSSVLRVRVSEHADSPLQSLSRDTGVRITVAIPVFLEERVVGAVMLSRTPMTLAKAFYGDRFHLLSAALVLLFVLGLSSLAASALIFRPLKRLVAQARAIGLGADEKEAAAVDRPVVAEVAELSVAMAKMAESLRERDEYIRSFAANVSHEFKTPLAAMKGAIELVRDGGAEMDPAQRDRFLANIDDDATRLTSLVQKLLELARAEATRAAAKEIATPLSPLLDALAARAERSGSKLTIEKAPGSLLVRAPPEILDTVLWQLAQNAREHGGDAVSVSISVSLPDPGHVLITVRDDGPGVSPGNREKIFDAFFTTRRERGGTGLGLTIARALLRPFGGDLTLLPPEGKGAAFAVSLQRK